MAQEGASKSRDLRARLVELCYKPAQLRAVLTVVLLGAWYVGIAMPLTAEIDETATRVEREKKRLGLACEIEKLRAQVARFQDRIPEKTDPNEWVQYMLDGVRHFPKLKLLMLDTDGTKEVGPYKAIVVKLDVEGDYREIDRFVRWIESNKRLLRVDSLRLEPQRGPRDEMGKMTAQLIVMGAMS